MIIVLTTIIIILLCFLIYYQYNLYNTSSGNSTSRSSFGFIIPRCVKKEEHNNAWHTCYNTIRKYYTEPIIFIDDNSNKNIIKDIPMINTIVIESQFKGSAEMLPYYYYHLLKPFEKAVIMQDSMSFLKKFDFENYPLEDVIFLWDFTRNLNHHIDNERFMLNLLSKPELIQLYESKNWRGSLGGSSFITYKFLDMLQIKYNYLRWVNILNKDKKYRYSFERTFAVMCWYESKSLKEKTSINGDLHTAVGYSNNNSINTPNLYKNSYMFKQMYNR